jgi:hypothetical protein
MIVNTILPHAETAERDPYFNNVVYNFTANGSNGQGNLVFLDSSPLNKTITSYGASRNQGTFNPFKISGLGGASFQASVPIYHEALSTDIDTNGVFTIECWVRITDTGNNPQGIFSIGYGSSTYGQIGLNWISTTQELHLVNIVTNTTLIATPSGTINQLYFYHVAISRNSSGVISLYVNGVRLGQTTYTSNFGSVLGASMVRVAASASGAGIVNCYYSGIISDFQVRLEEKYSGATVAIPTGPLLSAGSVFHMKFNNGGIIDASRSRNGTPNSGLAASTTQAKFGTCSIYFDGVDDFISTATTAVNPVNTTGDFTIELWEYHTSNTTTKCLIASHIPTTNPFVINATTGYLSSNLSGAIISTTTVCPINTWNHLAYTRSGTTHRLFLNGVLLGTTTNASMSNIDAYFNFIGQTSSSTNYFGGWMDEVRFTLGVARYTANFSVPFKPFPRR